MTRSPKRVLEEEDAINELQMEMGRRVVSSRAAPAHEIDIQLSSDGCFPPCLRSL